MGRCTSFCKYDHGREINISDLETKIDKFGATEVDLKQKIKILEHRVDQLERAEKEKDVILELLATYMVKVAKALETMHKEKNINILYNIFTCNTCSMNFSNEKLLNEVEGVTNVNIKEIILKKSKNTLEQIINCNVITPYTPVSSVITKQVRLKTWRCMQNHHTK